MNDNTDEGVCNNEPDTLLAEDFAPDKNVRSLRHDSQPIISGEDRRLAPVPFPRWTAIPNRRGVAHEALMTS